MRGTLNGHQAKRNWSNIMTTELTFEAEPFALSQPPARSAKCKCAACQASSGLAGQAIADPELWTDEIKRPGKTPARGSVPFRKVAGKVPGLSRAGVARTTAAPQMARSVVRSSVGGFARYRNDVASLPPDERQRIDRLAQSIVETHVNGSSPINTIRVIGHADFDTPRRPVFENYVSAQRARSAMLALRAAIDFHGARLAPSRTTLSHRIKWQRFAVGATMPAVARPRSETERARNRRVDILLETERPLAPPRQAFAQISTRQQVLAPPSAQPSPACIPPSPNQSVVISPGPNMRFDATVSTLAFNPSTIGSIQQVMNAGTQVITAMRFSCHRVIAQPGGCVDIIPAWRFGASLTAVLPSTEPFADWESGFMQTVSSSAIRHLYTGGTHECVTSSPTRDAMIGSQPLWFDARFVPALDDATRNPVIEDTPRTDAQLSRPGLGDLRQVCFEGVFQIWFAVRKARPPAAPILLAFKEIEVRRSWTLIPGRSPTDTAAWVHRGGQREIRRGSGTDAKLPRPVVTGRTANEQQGQCFRDVTRATSLCPQDALPEFANLCITGVTCPAVP